MTGILSKALALVLAGAALASCGAHGQAGKIDPKVHKNYVPYDKAFHEALLTGRVWLFEGLGRFRNVMQGYVFGSDGKAIKCTARRRLDGKLLWVPGTSYRWSLIDRHPRAGVRVQEDRGGGLQKYASKFYDPETGSLSTEIRHEGSWLLANPGQIQDSWPRALADACPTLKLPAGMSINEKQTSLRMDELRRQDPTAPIRHFPGSEHRAPGRTGLGASQGAPTTTRDEVMAFLRAEDGNILKGTSGRGYAWTRYGDRDELWWLGGGGVHEDFMVPVWSADGSRMTVRVGDREVVYHVGYPFPLEPTGHRHPAWQITDWLIASGHVLEVPGLGAAWRGVRFHANHRAEAFPAPGGPAAAAGWRWTQGQLQVWLGGVSAAEHWRSLADRLNMGVTVWTPDTPNTGT